MQKQIVLTVGGTGGHVFPAIALHQQIERERSDWNCFFLGGKLEHNSFFTKDEKSYYSISCDHLNYKNPFRLALSCGRILLGIIQSRKILIETRADCVVGFGSFATLPTLLAASWLKIPIIIHEQNSIPGKVNRFFAKKAKATCVHFPNASFKLKNQALHVPIPLREGFKKDLISKLEARKTLNLDPDKRTLLVFGGSQGAQALNRFFGRDLLHYFKSQEFQIIHITGNDPYRTVLKEQYEAYGIGAYVTSFLNRMNLAWQACDFIISRAGAGTIAEAIEFEIPAIYIPYPFAADGHQFENAKSMKNAGCSLLLKQEHVTEQSLIEQLNQLVKERVTFQSKIREFKEKQNQDSIIYVVNRILEDAK